MGVIYLVRHGKAFDGLPSTESGQMEDSYDHLSELGHAQATATGRALSERIAPGVPPALVSGPLRRQQDTATHIAAATGSTNIHTDPRWAEFNSDTVIAPYLHKHPEQAARLRDLEPTARDRLLGSLIGAALKEWAGSDDFEEFCAGVQDALADATTRATEHGGCAIVATSGGPIALAAVESMGLPLQAWPRFAGKVLTASVTVLSFSADNPPTLLSFNEHAHLDAPTADGSRPLRRFR